MIEKIIIIHTVSFKIKKIFGKVIFNVHCMIQKGVNS